jgi:hypothetical protein
MGSSRSEARDLLINAEVEYIVINVIKAVIKAVIRIFKCAEPQWIYIFVKTVSDEH